MNKVILFVWVVGMMTLCTTGFLGVDDDVNPGGNAGGSDDACNSYCDAADPYGDFDDDYDDDVADYASISIDDLPQTPLVFISANYPGITIVSAQIDDDGYEVFLSKGLELNFDLNGNFLYEG